jgi:hypothetical protein
VDPTRSCPPVHKADHFHRNGQRATTSNSNRRSLPYTLTARAQISRRHRLCTPSIHNKRRAGQGLDSAQCQALLATRHLRISEFSSTVPPTLKTPVPYMACLPSLTFSMHCDISARYLSLARAACQAFEVCHPAVQNARGCASR